MSLLNPSPDRWAAARLKMVDRQIRKRGIRDERVLRAMAAVPRHEFVPPAMRARAYDDEPLPLDGGQTISQPYIVAQMTEALALRGPERVLEVGAGSGYQAAVLAMLAARVISLERDPDLAQSARETLERTGFGALVEIIIADGSVGYAPAAPYDAILVAAAAPRIPPSLLAQLRNHGRLVMPVGDRISQDLVLSRRFGAEFSRSVLGGCRFVPLVGKEGV